MRGSDQAMTSDTPQGLGLCRFQIQRDKDGRHRWYVFNANGTMVGRHSEGFPTEHEARFDAERFREQIASAPIVGEDGEAGPRLTP
jgi:uncharacterized protein YegP (UPF0339 family)